MVGLKKEVTFTFELIGKIVEVGKDMDVLAEVFSQFYGSKKMGVLVEDCHVPAVVDKYRGDTETAAKKQDRGQFESVVCIVDWFSIVDTEVVEVGSARKTEFSCVPCGCCSQPESGMVGSGHVIQESVVDAERGYKTRSLEGVAQFGTPCEIGLIVGIVVHSCGFEV